MPGHPFGIPERQLARPARDLDPRVHQPPRQVARIDLELKSRALTGPGDRGGLPARRGESGRDEQPSSRPTSHESLLHTDTIPNLSISPGEVTRERTILDREKSPNNPGAGEIPIASTARALHHRLSGPMMIRRIGNCRIENPAL